MPHPIRRVSALALVAIVVFSPAHGVEKTRKIIDEFFDDFAAAWVRADPDLATGLRYFTGDQQDQLERQLTPRTRERRLERVKTAKEGLRELATFDRTRLTSTQRVSAELMQWQLEQIVRSEAYFDYSFPLEQFGGANVGLVETLSLRHPLTKPRDAENYLARLALVGKRMDEVVDDARRSIRRKMTPPRFILDATLRSMHTFRDVPAEQNALVTTYAQKLRNIDGLAQARRDEFVAEAARIVAQDVYPAWTRAMTVLESLVPQAPDDAGLWRFKGGDAAYAWFLQRSTTTSLTPDEIHQIGLDLVTKIEGEMDTILKQIGRTEGTVRARMDTLERDLAYPDATSEATRTRIMRDVDNILKDAVQRSTRLIERQPQAPVIAQPFPRFLETTAAANYNRAPLDNSRPAIFQIPLRPERMTRMGLRTLVYHETVPGHHFQVALEQENPALPRFRQSRAIGGVAALSEGWALYAEQLAVESGWYEGDPEGQLGQLDAALFRARRLVVDTGLHAKHWTRQQAIDFGIEASEVERYVVNPGQACSYMIGKLRILELREHAQKTLGAKFSLPAFHNTVLETGSVPLSILSAEVDRYLNAAK